MDELESAGSRAPSDQHGSSNRQQVINEALALIDEAGSAKGVMLICATNYGDAIAPADIAHGAD